MENRTGAIVAHDREADPRLIRVAADVRLARTAARELLGMEMPRVNMLLVGRAEIVRLVLRTLLVCARKPIIRWSPGEALVLPTGERSGTLVLCEVGSLGMREQIQLLEWSARVSRHTQTICTASAPLLPRIAAGHFNESLYYRLNTVYLDTSGLADVA